MSTAPVVASPASQEAPSSSGKSTLPSKLLATQLAVHSVPPPLVIASRIFIDVETTSEVDLPTVGSDVYFSHPSTRVICLEGVSEDGTLELTWTEGQAPPPLLLRLVLYGWTFVAHGQVFERLAFERILCPRHGFAMPEHWACSMMRARYNALPAALEYAAAAAGLEVAKDMAGARLMRTMCRPRTIDADGTRHWWHLEDPAKVVRLKSYCKQDCVVSRALWKVTRTPPEAAQTQYALVARMNKRGIRVDLAFAQAAVRLAKAARLRIDTQLRWLTRGAVSSATKVAALKSWIALFGIELTSLDKRDVARFLARAGEDLPEAVRQAIALRLEAAKSSVSKYQAMLERANADGRVEDSHVWHGAGPGRLSSQGLQTQNFRREIHPQAVRAMAMILKGADPLTIELMFGEPLELLSTLLRPALIPRPGRLFVGVDLAQIEARITAWLARDKRILALFASGADVYRHVAADLFHLALETITNDQRQQGKVCDLAFGFGGAVGALQSMARQYGLPAFDDEEAQRLVDAWREARPLYPVLWKAIEYAARMAVTHPGKPWHVACGADLDYASDGRHLYLRLPSGRLVTYRDARLVETMAPWGELTLQIEASGINSKTKRYERYILNRVILTENAVQAIAADVMFAGLAQCDASGYEPMLSVHDEIVCEPPPELAEEARVRMLWIVTAPLTWAKGLPLAAKVWRGARYLKQ